MPVPNEDTIEAEHTLGFGYTLQYDYGVTETGGDGGGGSGGQAFSQTLTVEFKVGRQ